jgi:hypothetical protein
VEARKSDTLSRLVIFDLVELLGRGRDHVELLGRGRDQVELLG